MSEKGIYVCTKCGLEGSSKCAGQRTMFPKWHGSAHLTTDHGVKYKLAYVRNEETGRMEVDPEGESLVLTEVFPGDTQLERMQHLVKMVANEPEHVQSFLYGLCDHRWKLTSAECQLGCCKKETND